MKKNVTSGMVVGVLASLLCFISCTSHSGEPPPSNSTASQPGSASSNSTASSASPEKGSDTLPENFEKVFAQVSGGANMYELNLRRSGASLSGTLKLDRDAPPRQVKGSIDAEQNIVLKVFDSGQAFADVKARFTSPHEIEGTLDDYDFKSRERAAGEKPAEPVLSLGEQAKAQATSYYNKRVLACEETGDYYTQRTSTRANGRFLEIYQLRGFSWEIKDRSHTIKEAGRLNGLEWTGAAVSTTSACRRHTSPGGGWSQWGSGDCFLNLSFELRKRNGEWSIDPTGFSSLKEVQTVECAKVPE